MVADPRLDQLLLRWEELHERGSEISAEELCRDTPELVGELSRRIRDLKFMDGLLGPSPEAQADRPTQTGDGTVTPADQPAPDDDTRKLFASLSPAQSPDELGRLGVYRILRVLGSGGMGVVFQAEDSQLKRQVALKLMKPSLAASESARQRFLREAQAAASLEHEHVVPIYQVGLEGNVPFLAMQFLHGETLQQRLDRAGKLPLLEILSIGRQIAEGLAVAHERGLIHRDIKPANIFLVSGRVVSGGVVNDRPGDHPPPTTHYSPRIKLLDFGLARPAGETRLTQSGAVLGTPAYMSPEQAAGRPVDHRTDLFSLGCVLYRMCSGELPFHGSDAMAVLWALANHQPKPPHEVAADIPKPLSDLVMKLLAKNPADRPASALAVTRELANVAADLQSAGAATTTVDPVPRETPRNSADSAVHILNRGVNGVRGAGKRRWPRVAAAMLLVGVILAGISFTLRTRHGTLVLTVSEPDVKVFIDGEEKVIIDSKKIGRIELGLGKHKLVVKRGIEELYTESFTIKSGDETAIDARWTPDVASATEKTPPKTFTNTLGMEFVLVPRGKSWLGGGGGNRGTKAVDIPYDFYLGRYEVTQEEWERMTGHNPSHFQTVPGFKDQDLKRFPVECVSWGGAREFAARLNEKCKEAGWVYRLPAEVEWEYACRGGPMDEPSETGFDYYLQKPSNLLSPSDANFAHAKDLKRTCKVGSYRPNRLGLYDMHGNVWEWCLDEIKDDKGASRRMGRGGGWGDDAGRCRAAHRDSSPPSNRSPGLGLRLARVPVGQATDSGPRIVTLRGTITCAKCDLKLLTQEKCATVIVTKEDGQELVHYFDQAGNKK